ncbi:hypothetical protein ACIF9R_34115 [Streptomyces sp. NPDC086080]|uniref:hypothetical protein n=1 Tax=Streptomyces sp. NPDC086080 TaxID=3365748 RepID=UPI0037D60F23
MRTDTGAMIVRTPARTPVRAVEGWPGGGPRGERIVGRARYPGAPAAQLPFA